MGSQFPPAQDLWHAQYRNKHGGILPRKEDWASRTWLIAYDSHRQHVCEESDASWSREGVGSSLFHGADVVKAVLAGLLEIATPSAQIFEKAEEAQFED